MGFAASQQPEGTARRGNLYKDWSRASMRSRVPSMLFECEVEEAPCSAPLLDCDALDAVVAVRSLISCPPVWSLQVAADVHSAMRELQHSEQSEDDADDRSTSGASDAGSERRDASDACMALAHALSAKGHRVSIRHCLGGGSGGACLRNLRHCFLSFTPPRAPRLSKAPDARASPLAFTPAARDGAASPGLGSLRAPGDAGVTRLIIDPCFREQFEIAHATPRYAAVLEVLPAVYIGPEDRMPALVELLCAEMSLAFKAQNVLLPPWRQAKSMLSKWQPRRSLEEHVGFGAAHGGARACSPGCSDGSSSDGGSGRSGSLGSGGSRRVVMEPWARFVGGDFAVVEVAPTSPAA